MVIWPAFRMGQYRVNDHPYHAPQFIDRMDRLNSGIKNRLNFFAWAIFLIQKFGTNSVNHADSGDIQPFYTTPGIQFWNFLRIFEIAWVAPLCVGVSLPKSPPNVYIFLC